MIVPVEIFFPCSCEETAIKIKDINTQEYNTFFLDHVEGLSFSNGPENENLERWVPCFPGKGPEFCR